MVVAPIGSARLALAAPLTAWGCIVDAAGTAEAALKRVRAAEREGSPYGLVFIDDATDAACGRGLAHALRNDPLTATVPLIRMRSVILATESVAARDQVFDATLSKPVRRSPLRGILSTLFDHSHKSSARDEAKAEETPRALRHLALRVLVAEDQEINRKTVGRMLENLGCKVEFAENGRQALAAFRPEKYDVVLMDVRMPIMDGLEATAAIRRLERDTGAGRRTPVLALTAHAMAGDRQLCLDAGMDGYLSKPVKHRHLLEKLAPFSERRPGRLSRAGSGRSPSPGTPSRPIGRARRGRRRILRELLAAFLKGAVRGLTALEGGPDASQFAAAAHALRGSALTIGADSLAAAAAALESRAGRAPAPDSDTLLSLAGAGSGRFRRPSAYVQTARAGLLWPELSHTG